MATTRVSKERLHRPLLVVSLTLAALSLVGIAGTLFDDRELIGAPIWMKPLKFMISFALYTGTLAWMLSLQTKARRLGWWMGTVVATGIAVEMALIIGQVVVRGRQLHFNMSTPADEQLHNTMATTIYLVWAAIAVIAVQLLFDKPGDRALRWSIRLALGGTLAGMVLANLMFRATPAQQRAEAETGRMDHFGSHSVGVEDGIGDGRNGLPVTGWSTRAGDLRIGHFLGVHTLQAIPLLALGLLLLAQRFPRLRPEGTRTALVFVGTAAWAGLVWLTTWQALRGESVVHPGGTTLAAAGILVGAVGLTSYDVLARGGRTTLLSAGSRQ